MNRRSRLGLCAFVAAVFVVLAGCSAPDDGDSGSGETITVDHQYGTTTVPANPKRVVVFGGIWTDSLVKLGVPITAEFVTAGYAGPGNRFEWTPEHSGEVVAGSGPPDVAQVAAFKPDLIVAGEVGYLPDQSTYERLSRLAPTIPVTTKGAVGDRWQDTMVTAGKIFGKQEQAAAAIADVEGKLSAARAEYPNAAGKTFTFGQLSPDQRFAVVTSENDPATRLLAQLGLRLDPAVMGLSDSGQRTFVSQERVDLLSSDVLVFWPLVGGPAAFSRVPGWDQLPAVRSGTTLFLNNDNATGLGSPTVYSVPWFIDTMKPVLAKI
nr:ABC transporter substrate-binding protein [Gordonia soli]